MAAELTKEWFAERGEQEPDYIGDGVYVSFDGFSFWLRTPRENGIHEIAIDTASLAKLDRYVHRVLNKIIEKKAE